MEVKMFILSKNLRYLVENETVLMNFERNISKSYEVYFSQIQNPNFIQNSEVQIDFAEEKILKKVLEGVSEGLNS